MPIIHHGRLKEPSFDQTIWRYISLGKFKDLLASSELYLCRLDKFELDPKDGSVPKENYKPHARRTVQNIEIVIERVTKDGRFAFQNNSRPKSVPLTEFYSNSDFELSVKSEAANDEHNRKSMFANCWHKNTGESETFWKNYESEPSVAIKSSVRNLRTAFSRCSDRLFLFDVEYFDEGLSIPSQNCFYQVGFKRRQFEFENEVRLVYWCHQTTNREREPRDSKRIKVNTNELISELWLPPKSDDKYFTEVNALMQRYGIKSKIMRSRL